MVFKFSKFKKLRSLSLSAFAVLLSFYFLISIQKDENSDMRTSIEPGRKLLIKRFWIEKQRMHLYKYKIPFADISEETVQRLIGLPGDTIEIRDKVVLINGIPLDDPEGVCYNFNFQLKRPVDTALITSFGMFNGKAIGLENEYCFTIPQRYEHVLTDDSVFVFFERKTDSPNRRDTACFPNDTQWTWNMDFYGPLYIPKKGDTIWEEDPLLNYYLKINCPNVFSIAAWTNTKRRYRIVQTDLYFFMGDNRDNANDSRNWGLISNEFITGKAFLFE